MQGLSARRGLSIIAATTLGMLGVAGVANAATVGVNDSGSQTAPHLHAKGLLHAGSGLTHTGGTVSAGPKLHAKGLLHAGSGLTHTGGMVAGAAAILVRAIAQASSGLTTDGLRERAHRHRQRLPPGPRQLRAAFREQTV
jgi:hypothetical protein